MTFTASDVLLKAASRIEEEGMWCRGIWHAVPEEDLAAYDQAINDSENFMMAAAQWVTDKGLRVAECAEGAITSAALELFGFTSRGQAMAIEAIRQMRGLVSLYTFNDIRAQNGHEVAEVMRKAAL